MDLMGVTCVMHPRVVLGAIGSFLEPFCGHLSPKIDKVSEELTLRYHHEEPWVEVDGGGAAVGLGEEVAYCVAHQSLVSSNQCSTKLSSHPRLIKPNSDARHSGMILICFHQPTALIRFH